MRAIVISEHDPAWAAAFASERSAIELALGHDAVAVEHVGSTAVPGLPAKPIIDIAIGLGVGADPEGCPVDLAVIVTDAGS